MKKQSLFQYAIVAYTYNKEEDKTTAVILVEQKTVAAHSQTDASILAYRDIPQDAIDKYSVENISVFIRPF